MSRIDGYVLFITPDGDVRFIHDDDVAEALHPVGTPTTKRASDVEPTVCGNWAADMKRVGGPVLGPFATRREALRAEVLWLLNHDLPNVLR